ncbi:MAG TPA: sigma-70 family RNA polymerase sigma factor [Gemmatimonadaceae bacterium]
MSPPAAAPSPFDQSSVPVSGTRADSAMDLIQRAKRGDPDAFEGIYRENVGRVYALALRLAGGDAQAAAELTQDVFIRAWRGLGSFRGDSAFSSWLHRLAVNAMLENARKDKRRVARVLPMDEPERLDAFAATDSPDARMDLETAITLLPPGARTAFVLHDIEGYQHAEIAERLGVAVGTVKAQLHRAHKLLIKALER